MSPFSMAPSSMMTVPATKLPTRVAEDSKWPRSSTVRLPLILPLLLALVAEISPTTVVPPSMQKLFFTAMLPRTMLLVIFASSASTSPMILPFSSSLWATLMLPLMSPFTVRLPLVFKSPTMVVPAAMTVTSPKVADTGGSS